MNWLSIPRIQAADTLHGFECLSLEECFETVTYLDTDCQKSTVLMGFRFKGANMVLGKQIPIMIQNDLLLEMMKKKVLKQGMEYVVIFGKKSLRTPPCVGTVSRIIAHDLLKKPLRPDGGNSRQSFCIVILGVWWCEVIWMESLELSIIYETYKVYNVKIRGFEYDECDLAARNMALHKLNGPVNKVVQINPTAIPSVTVLLVFEEWLIESIIGYCRRYFGNLVRVPNKCGSDLVIFLLRVLPISVKQQRKVIHQTNTVLQLVELHQFLEHKNLVICLLCGVMIAKVGDVLVREMLGTVTHVNAVGMVADLVLVSTVYDCSYSGEGSAENTWFLDYLWYPLHCGRCLHHVGWFYKAEHAEKRPQSFYGLLRVAIRAEFFSFQPPISTVQRFYLPTAI